MSEQKHMYLVMFKAEQEGKPFAWFCDTPEKASSDVSEMMQDHGGVAVVAELVPEEIASLFLKDWFNG